MDELVAGIEEVTLNSEKPKNWGDLPMEMRLECIKHMDLRTRLCLRMTSTTEKSLVESNKFSVEMVSVKFEPYSSSIRINENGHKYIIDFEKENPRREVLRSFVSILKLPIFIKSLEYHDKVNQRYVKETLAELQKCAPFQFENISITAGRDPRVQQYLLKNCSVPLKEVEYESVGSSSRRQQLNKALFKIPQFYNAKCIIFLENSDLFPLRLALQKWIDIDAPIGSVLFRGGWNRNEQIPYAEMFPDRVIEGGDRFFARIRMNDEKHIFCKLSREFYDIFGDKCQIIAASAQTPSLNPFR